MIHEWAKYVPPKSVSIIGRPNGVPYIWSMYGLDMIHLLLVKSYTKITDS